MLAGETEVGLKYNMETSNSIMNGYTTSNITFFSNSSWSNFSVNSPNRSEIAHFLEFERYVRIIVPTIFGLIVVVGLFGNLLVILVVLSNQQMRNTTNVLIVSLAVADLSFIIFCVPFTATAYALPVWPFGDIWCRIVQYLLHVCAYASVYTLVLMSLDRYLAVVHPITSMSLRTVRNTYFAVVIIWIIIFLGNIPLLYQYTEMVYDYYGETRSACLNNVSFEDPHVMKIVSSCFFAFGYVLPLTLVCLLYGLMLKRLLYGIVPGVSQRAESMRSKKRVTKMIVIVVVVFALCWLPIQIIFILQAFGPYSTDIHTAAAQFAANCLAYMNSCVNPILYAFLSDNFRRSFKKLLCCSTGQYTKFEYEKTNVKNFERERNDNHSTRCATSMTTMQTFYNGNDAANNSDEKNANKCALSEL
ncbi:hypothetical protein CHS0354_033310 [Potamilus streckersoni]|uniref:G-protein coupled receptors family 1 profile domain-containing protein n=1 Tax=Potamilus streckersoni TaxID=2493646 RepID=A0AAE0VI77_9BIVA|nr:hypothetical protein CHS0354_033310 [Potamilus streckersoni]